MEEGKEALLRGWVGRAPAWQKPCPDDAQSYAVWFSRDTTSRCHAIITSDHDAHLKESKAIIACYNVLMTRLKRDTAGTRLSGEISGYCCTRV